MTNTPSISAVIPAYNCEKTLPICLEALRQSTVPLDEIIVVDDGSTDRTRVVAAEWGATLLEVPENRQANYCRNFGAARARGELILFVDCDVVPEPDALRNALRVMTAEQVDAVIGIYSLKHRHPNLSSQYKNLWIRYSYLRADPSLDWVFGAIALMRKCVFDEVGGFDHTLFMHKGGDLELGKRMAHRRPAIRFSPSVEAEHLKRHTLRSLLKNDFQRSQGFIQLAVRLGQLSRSLKRGFVNIYPVFAYSILLVWGLLSFLILSFWYPAFLWLALAAAIVYVAANIPFLFFYARARRMLEVPLVLGILIFDHLVCGFGCLKGLIQRAPRT